MLWDRRFLAGCYSSQEALLLAYIPVRIDLYRPIRAEQRWTLQCLVSFADKDGRCWPSIRKLAEVTGHSKSSVSRHLIALSRNGTISRTRKPGGVYLYTIDSRFLPARCGESRDRDPSVPPVSSQVSRSCRTEEKTLKKTSDSDDCQQWERRLRSWHHSGGKFWLPFWGPKPSEPGCFAPAALLAG